MLNCEKDLLDRRLPKILADNPGLAEKIAAMPDPGAAALAVVKNSPDSESGEPGPSRAEWIRNSPSSDFMAYAERVKNDNVGGCTPWDEDSSSGFSGRRRTEMDAFVRPASATQEIAGVGEFLRRLGSKASPNGTIRYLYEKMFKGAEYGYEGARDISSDQYKKAMGDPERQPYSFVKSYDWPYWAAEVKKAYPGRWASNEAPPFDVVWPYIMQHGGKPLQ